MKRTVLIGIPILAFCLGFLGVAGQIRTQLDTTKQRIRDSTFNVIVNPPFDNDGTVVFSAEYGHLGLTYWHTSSGDGISTSRLYGWIEEDSEGVFGPDAPSRNFRANRELEQ